MLEIKTRKGQTRYQPIEEQFPIEERAAIRASIEAMAKRWAAVIDQRIAAELEAEQKNK